MRASALAAAVLAAACTAKPPPDDVTVAPFADCAMHGSGGTAMPAPKCMAGTKWVPGTRAFVERTHEWGLDTLAVRGQRLSVADLDHDGWPDLVVRAVGVKSNDLKAGGARYNFVLRNTGKGTFEDVTESSGVMTSRTQDATVGRPGEVWVFGDVDNDGDLDLYTGLDTENPAASLGETSEVMLNDGKGHFTLGPADSALRRAGQVDNPGGAAFLDFDGDGRLDLWSPQNNTADGTFLQSHLYKGDATGAFADVTEAAGLTTLGWDDLTAINEGRAHARAWAAAACDLNGDGVPELLTSSYGRAPNHLFQGVSGPDGSTSYVNRSVKSGYAFDQNQGWKDNQFARCYCAATPNAPECNGVESPDMKCDQRNWSPDTDTQPLRLGGNSGTTVCADLDNDGDLDLVTSEIEHWWAGTGSDHAEVLVNTGEPDVRFERPGRESMGIVVPHTDPGGWNEGIMTAAVLDFDNDGWPDIYWGMSDYGGNHGLLLHQKSRLQFETVPVADGIDQHRSHGVVFADFDRDGDLDMVVGHSRSRCDPAAPDDCYETTQVRYFENVLGQAGNWVQLELEGCSQTNRSAIGARVTVTTPDGNAQTQEVGGGFGHFGAQNDLALHFGLGAGCEADVTIRWPNRARSAQLVRVVAGHRFRIHESGGPALADVVK